MGLATLAHRNRPLGVRRPPEDTLIVSHEHGFVFLKTRKTAGTSVEIALSRICGDDDVITPLAEPDEVLRRAAGGRAAQNHTAPPLARPVFAHTAARAARRSVGRATWRRLHKISLERNPWDAVVSLYFWHYRDVPEAERPSFADYLAGPRPVSLARENGRAYRIEGRVVVDTMLRQESLTADLASLWERLALPGEPMLPRAKGGSRPASARGYAELYSPATSARVAEVFAEQIELTGYEF